MAEELFMTVEEAAKRLRASTHTLARWRWKGEGPKFLKRKGRVLYSVKALEEYESSIERQSTRGN